MNPQPTLSSTLHHFYLIKMITLGGNAELELVDSLDPFSEGIVFSVMPPKKSWKNISNLSGGEKVGGWVDGWRRMNNCLVDLSL